MAAKGCINLAAIVLLVALVHVARGERTCWYPGSTAVALPPKAPSQCSINYASYVDSPIDVQTLRTEYSARCPSIVNETTPVYTVGGLASRGNVTFYDSYRNTFETVLNEALACAKGFLFQTVALSSDAILQKASDDDLEFVFNNPSGTVCSGTAGGLRPIATIVSVVSVSNQTYQSGYYGGDIIVRADSNITALDQIRGYTISCTNLGGLGSLQLQWQLLNSLGISIFADSRMLIFAQSPNRVVFDVLNGRADVGFVRSDQLALMNNTLISNGSEFTASSVRVLQPMTSFREYQSVESSYPFPSTTPLVPEWALSMQASADPDVAIAVLGVLFGIQAADPAAQQGRYSRWQPPADYLKLLTLNVGLGLTNITTGECSALNDTYAAIQCPAGFFKKARAWVQNSCHNAGVLPHGSSTDCFPVYYNSSSSNVTAALAYSREMNAADGYYADAATLTEARKYGCVCSPCAQIPEHPVIVVVSKVVRGGQDLTGQASFAGDVGRACSRLQECVAVVAGDVVTMQVVDVLGLEGRAVLGLSPIDVVQFSVINDGASNATTLASNATATNGTAWEFSLQMRSIGQMLVLVMADGQNIDASPFLVLTSPGRAAAGFPHWAVALVAVGGVVLVSALTAALVLLLLRPRRVAFTLEEHYADVAATLLGDIEFIRELGAGSYGKVYHAVWQGTHVAVKVIEHVSAAIIEMAEREARISTELAHPNIVLTLHYAVRGANGQTVGGVMDTPPSSETKVGALLKTLLATRRRSSAGNLGSRHGSSVHNHGSRHNDAGIRSGKITTAAAVNSRSSIKHLITTHVPQEVTPGPTAEGIEGEEGCDVAISTDEVFVTHVGLASIDHLHPRETLLARSVSTSEYPRARGSASFRRFDSGSARAEAPARAGPRVTLADDSGKSHSKGGDSPEESTAGTNTWGSFASGLEEAALRSEHRANGSGAGECRSSTDVSVQTWIIQEYCDKGSLSAVIAGRPFRDGRHSEERNMKAIVRSCLDVAKGMQYLHEKGIIHSDLKTGNVLLQSVGDGDARGFRCKVGDFGLSRTLEAGQSTINTNTFGTVTHMPPELLMNGRLSEKADVYSFGMLMWEVHCGRHPFSLLTHAEIVTRVIVKGERPVWPENTSLVFRNIAEKCWSAQPEVRPTFDMIVSQLEGLCTNLA